VSEDALLQYLADELLCCVEQLPMTSPAHALNQFSISVVTLGGFFVWKKSFNDPPDPAGAVMMFQVRKPYQRDE
jgi:hypothetical protein